MTNRRLLLPIALTCTMMAALSNASPAAGVRGRSVTLVAAPRGAHRRTQDPARPGQALATSQLSTGNPYASRHDGLDSAGYLTRRTDPGDGAGDREDCGRHICLPDMTRLVVWRGNQSRRLLFLGIGAEFQIRSLLPSQEWTTPVSFSCHCRQSSRNRKIHRNS